MRLNLRGIFGTGWTNELAFIEWSHYPLDGVTFCHLFREKDEKREGIDWGVSILSPKDVYSKEVGRKVSLERLMERLSLEREERIRIWKEYAIQTHKPWASQFSTQKPTSSLARSAE